MHKMKNYYPVCENVSSVKIDEEVNSNNILTTEVNNVTSKYIAVLDIPKIFLKRYLYPIDSSLNNVDYNVEILSSSQMPDVTSGNLILAAHSGSSVIAHFHDLNQVDIGDEILVYYNNNVYNYIVEKKYTVPKTGEVAIKRNREKTTITLITCYGDNEQLVVIGYLKH